MLACVWRESLRSLAAPYCVSIIRAVVNEISMLRSRASCLATVTKLARCSMPATFSFGTRPERALRSATQAHSFPTPEPMSRSDAAPLSSSHSATR